MPPASPPCSTSPASYRAERARPRRSILFVAVTGEEKGLLGSRWFARAPTVPRALDRRRPQLRHGAAALPAALDHDARLRRKQPRRRRARGRRADGPADRARSLPGAQLLHPLRPVQLHRGGHPVARLQVRLRAGNAGGGDRGGLAARHLSQPAGRSVAARLRRRRDPPARFHRGPGAARRQCRRAARAGTTTASSAASRDSGIGRRCERSEAIQRAACRTGLLRRFAPRNDGKGKRGGRRCAG